MKLSYKKITGIVKLDDDKGNVYQFEFTGLKLPESLKDWPAYIGGLMTRQLSVLEPEEILALQNKVKELEEKLAKANEPPPSFSHSSKPDKMIRHKNVISEE